MIDNLLSAVVVAGLGLVVAWVTSTRFPAKESRFLLGAYAAYVLAAIAQVVITQSVYGGGDMFAYFAFGERSAAHFDRDFFDTLLKVGGLFFQTYRPIWVSIGAGNTTGSMIAVASIIVFLTRTVYGSVMLVAVGSYFGNLALYQVARERLPGALRQRVLIGTMLVPSTVFWSSGLLKESVVMCGLGWLILGLDDLQAGRRRLRGIALVLIAGTIIAMIKPYILLVLLAAVAVWIAISRGMSEKRRASLLTRPLYGVAGVGVGIVAILAFGYVFPRFSVTTIGDELSGLQTVGARISGGSNVTIGDASQRGLVAQMAFAPLALASALFRPLIIEVRNPMMFLNSIETTMFLFLFGSALRRTGPRAMLTRVLDNPLLIMSVVFVVLLAVGVGLGSTNLGSLSRYRMPLVPFFSWLLVVWAAPASVFATKPAETPRAPAPPMRSGLPQPLGT